jgi:CubicO group peptidase (beta-lactamase class C family)
VSQIPIHGSVEPEFEPVREVFEQGLEKEIGAAGCVYVDGRKVVDLWGGWTDAARTQEWSPDTIVTVYSATKAMTATCAHQLVERGLLDLDAPVAGYWPEFAQKGKGDVTVRMVLSHQAGLPWTTAKYPPERRWEWETLVDALARSVPVWEPGTRHEYHGGTFGYLVGELVRRVDGRPPDVYFREEVAEPLGLDFWMRFGPELDARCAEVVGDDDIVNTRVWREAGDCAATGHGSAESLARMYAALACGGELDGVRVLRPDTIEAAVQEQPLARAEGTAGEFGLGYQLFWKLFPGMNQTTFGHTGMGGSVGLGDISRRLGIGYVMNQMGSSGAAGLVNATYQVLIS